MSRDSTTFPDLSDAILTIKRIEVEGATIEDFRGAMVEIRTAFIHLQSELLIVASLAPDVPSMKAFFDALRIGAETGISLCNSFILRRDGGEDSKTLATDYYSRANLALWELLIDAIPRFAQISRDSLK